MTHNHQRVRQQHANEITQDYLEEIYKILIVANEVRVSDLQRAFDVSHVTVIKTLKRLEAQGLISGTKSRQIQLTQSGELIAQQAKERHTLITGFLIKLGVSPKQADADAEGVEHHLSAETLNAFKEFLYQ